MDCVPPEEFFKILFLAVSIGENESSRGGGGTHKSGRKLSLALPCTNHDEWENTNNSDCKQQVHFVLHINAFYLVLQMGDQTSRLVIEIFFSSENHDTKKCILKRFLITLPILYYKDIY